MAKKEGLAYKVLQVIARRLKVRSVGVSREKLIKNIEQAEPGASDGEGKKNRFGKTAEQKKKDDEAYAGLCAAGRI